MTIRTAPGPLVIDAGDFQLTHKGVTVGLKLDYVQTGVGITAAISVAEKSGSAWVLKETLIVGFENRLKTGGAVDWIVSELLPKLNEWLAARFATAPAPVPDWVPPEFVELNAALLRLKVSIVNGVPVVGV